MCRLDLYGLELMKSPFPSFVILVVIFVNSAIILLDYSISYDINTLLTSFKLIFCCILGEFCVLIVNNFFKYVNC